ncbi:MAG: DMT family transporter [Candidatus Heimdallarchaeota archaeon]|nr:MAG: DMT family transporter [Candidatus Heimdallarchaeota archaeon]
MQIFQNERQKAQLLLLNANFIWGITPIFLEVVLKYTTPLQATTIRFGMAAIILGIFLYLSKGKKTFSLVSVKMIILLGWLDALGYLTATIGQDLTTLGFATLLSSLYVFLVPFIAWKLEKTKIHRNVIYVGILSLFGVFLMSFNGNWSNFVNFSFIGNSILIFSAIMFGFYSVIAGKYLSESNNHEEKVNLSSFTFASLFHTFLALFIISFLIKEPLPSLPVDIFPYFIFLGLFPTFIALGLWNWALIRLGSVNTSFFQLLQILIPVVLEFILYQQIYSAWIYSGMALILISTLWINGSDFQKEEVTEELLSHKILEEHPVTSSMGVKDLNFAECCWN